MRAIWIFVCLFLTSNCFGQSIVRDGIAANLSVRFEKGEVIAEVEIENLRDCIIYLVKGDPYYSNAKASDKMDIWLLNPHIRYLDYPKLEVHLKLEVDLIKPGPKEKYRISKAKVSERVKEVVLSLEVILT